MQSPTDEYVDDLMKAKAFIECLICGDLIDVVDVRLICKKCRDKENEIRIKGDKID